MLSSSSPVSKISLDFEERNWESARKVFKAKHKDSDPKKIDAFLSERFSVRDAKAACKDANGRAKAQYSPTLGKIMEKIEIAMKVGDLAIKGAPESIGLAWASIRFCLHSVEDDFATFSLFTSACNDIIGILISCGVYGQMYGSEKGPASFQELHGRVVEYIPEIYFEILDFSYAMKKHINRSKLERIGRGVFASSAAKFQFQVQAIRHGEAKMKEYASAASQRLSIYYLEHGLENQGNMMNQLAGIQETMQSYLNLNAAFAERVRQLEQDRKTMRKKTASDIASEIFDENRKILNPSSDQRGTFNEKIGRREPNTCMWVFELKKYTDWRDSTESAIIWISGNGGYGKSVLMSAIIQQLQDDLTATSDSIIHFFYCTAGDESTQKTKRILNHLLFDLYRQAKQSLELLEDANKVISSYLRGNKSPEGSTIDASKDTITFEEAYISLAKILGRNVYVIVDAIDECNDREQQALLMTLRNLVKSKGVKIKIALCSRPESDIINSLDGVPQIKVEENNRPDIKQNATTELKKLPGWTSVERELACKVIVQKAGSFFRYVELAINFLHQPWQRPLENRLRELPEGLDNSYSQILQQTDPNYLGLLRTCLTWTILAAREITVAEVVDAYSRAYNAPGISVHDSHEDDVLKQTANNLHIEQIRLAGSSFLEVDIESKVISLHHNTVADYFLNQGKKLAAPTSESKELCDRCRANRNTNDPFTISQKAGHLEIATTLIEHLNSPIFCSRFFPGLENSPETGPPSSNNGASEPRAIDLKEEPFKSTNAQSADDSSEISTILVPIDDGTSLGTASRTSTTSQTVMMAAQLPGNGTENSAKDEVEALGPPQLSNLPPLADTVINEAGHLPEDDSDVDSDIALDEEDVEYQGNSSYHEDKVIRYEISHWSHHLKLAEKLCPADQRKGPEWARLWNALDSFFDNDSAAFRAWITMKCKSDTWPFSSMKPDEVRPIHIAAMYGLIGLTTRLLERGEDVSTDIGDGRQAIHLACDLTTEDQADKDIKFEMLKLLLEKGADANAEVKGDGSTPARNLVWNQPEKRLIELTLKHGGKFSELSSLNSLTPFHWAARFFKDVEAFKAIVESVTDINIKDCRGETALHGLLRRKETPIELLALLIEKGADVHAEDNESQQPLYEIAATGNVEALNIILDAGVDVNDDDINGGTALHIAAQRGHKETTRILVEKGAHVAQTDHQGRTPFFLACQSGNAETAMYLLKASEVKAHRVTNQVSKSGKTPLKKAAARGVVEVVRMLLKDDDVASTINDRDAKFQRTPLHSAAYNGHKEMIALLLEHGAQIDVMDKSGNTPLKLCIQGWLASVSDRHEAIILLLVDRQPEEAAKDGELLSAAATKGSLPMINKLLDLGADPNSRDEHGWTALQLAQQFGRFEAAELLRRRNVVSGMKPTRWAKTISKYAHISNQGMDIEHNPVVEQTLEMSIDERVSFITNHPIPAGVDKFYYEITIIHVSEKNPNPYLGIGVTHKISRLTRWEMGFKHEASPGSSSWVYYGDTGTLFRWPENGQIGCSSPGKFGLGDTIGCGIDCNNGKIFYTKNGIRLMDWAFEKIAGRLHLGVSIGNEAHVSTNFGTDLYTKPFKWAPGNSLDFDAK